MYPFQEDLVRTYVDHDNVSIVKGRQLGISTLSSAYCVWLMLFHSAKKIMVVATEFSIAELLVTRSKRMFKDLPPWFKQLADIGANDPDNLRKWGLSNGSIIFASTTTSNSGRGHALSLLIVDEAAHIDKLDDMMAAMAPTLSEGGSAIVLSTPNGASGWFYDNHMAAVAGENDYFTVSLPWTVHPHRDAEWFEKQRRLFNHNERIIAQELCCDFSMSGETVINPSALQRIKEDELRDPIAREGYDGCIWIWEDFNPMHQYVLCADVARGDGNDYSSFSILDTTTGEQVAEHQQQLEYDLFAQILKQWGDRYGQCLIVVENNKLGHAVCKELQRLDYPNIFFSKKGTHEKVDQWEAEWRNDAVAGFSMSMNTRPLIMGKLQEFVHGRKVKVRSSRLHLEMQSFIWKNGKEQARKSKNDDLIIAFALCCYISDMVFAEMQVQQQQFQDTMKISGFKKRSRRMPNASNVVGIDQNFQILTSNQIGRGGRVPNMKAYEALKYKWLQ